MRPTRSPCECPPTQRFEADRGQRTLGYTPRPENRSRNPAGQAKGTAAPRRFPPCKGCPWFGDYAVQAGAFSRSLGNGSRLLRGLFERKIRAVLDTDSSCRRSRPASAGAVRQVGRGRGLPIIVSFQYEISASRSAPLKIATCVTTHEYEQARSGDPGIGAPELVGRTHCDCPRATWPNELEPRSTNYAQAG